MLGAPPLLLWFHTIARSDYTPDWIGLFVVLAVTVFARVTFLSQGGWTVPMCQYGRCAIVGKRLRKGECVVPVNETVLLVCDRCLDYIKETGL